MRLSPRARGSLLALVLGGALVLSAGGAGATSTTVSPGRLPPTTQRPPSDPAALAARLTPLWRALVRGDVAAARGAFFPRDAYVRMKAGLLADPSADFAQRLVAFFDLDVGAYHRVLVAGGAPTLLRVSVAQGDVAWIAPHACENLIGYWHLPGVRFVYRQGSRVSSVAVDSLISWRGVWYVVHLGPNPRPSNVGTVDGYATGPGHPGPAGGC